MTRTPLQLVEDSVLAQARSLVLDPTTEPERLRALVVDTVASWNADHRRGIQPIAIADPETLVERVVRNLTGYGPLTPLLADDDVWEIMINSPSTIFVKRHVGPDGYHHEVFHDDAHVARTLTKILEDAGAAHRKLDPTEGLQDAQLDDGSRLHIVHQDIGRGGHLLVNIRRFTSVPFRRLDELVGRSMLSTHAATVLGALARARCSIVIAGAPGCGKTTLLSCCTAELDPSLRVVVAEEVFETDIPVANVASMQTRPARGDRAPVDLRRLVAGFLRMAPDVAIVGEVRDREALPLLLTLSSGVKGLTTIHAGSARQALTRLRFVCQLAAVDLPMAALNTLVAEAIDVVVHCRRTDAGPRVAEIVAVEDLAGGAEATQFTITPLFVRDDTTSELTWTGQIPVRLLGQLRAAGVDLRALLEPSAGHGGRS